MLTVVLLATALATLLPLVGKRFRVAAWIALSFAAIAWFDPKLVFVVGVAVSVTVVAMRLIARSKGGVRGLWAVSALFGLAVAFFWNKTGGGDGVLPSQSGLAWVGFSYLALKLAAAIVDTYREVHPPVPIRDMLGWTVFLPTFASGPVEELEHFRAQEPRASLDRSLRGAERILLGLIKTLLVARLLGEWSAPILLAPLEHSRPELLLAAYAFTIRFYLDFSGYSDIAIGAGALWGYEIQENFDRPLAQRNLVRLWQRWHMTLTDWLRRYLFVPISRRVLRLRGRHAVASAALVAQLVTMVACGLWHGATWGFALWGLLQGIGLVFVGVYSRRLGSHLPAAWLGWWRTSPLAHAASVGCTFTFFSISNVLAAADLDGARLFLATLLG